MMFDPALRDHQQWLGYAQPVGLVVSEAARRELLDRLFALNHRRHEEEVAAEALELR